MKMSKQILLVLSSFFTPLVLSTALKPSKHQKIESRIKSGRPDVLKELHHVSKKLDVFTQSTSDSKIAQTLSDLSKTLKTIKKNPRSITKEDVERAFFAIEESGSKLDASHDKVGLSGQCCCCDQLGCCKELKKLLCQIKNIIVKCCRHLSAEIEEIKKLINTKFPCAHSIKIDHVPFTIKKPGKYCVTKDLTFGGTGAAITVAVSNVTINFANHSLTLTDPAAVGISASGISELVIQNDIIQGPASTGTLSNAAILLTDTSKVTIDNVFTLNTYFGIHAISSDDITVTNSHFEHHIVTTPDATQPAAALRAEACNNLSIDACVFKNNSSGISFGIEISTIPNGLDGCKNVKLTNSELLDSALNLAKVDGSLIENCQCTITDPTLLKGIVLGTLGVTDFIANDIIIRNCSVLDEKFNLDFIGIWIQRGNGISIDTSIIDGTGTSIMTHVAQNVTISNSVMQSSFTLAHINDGSKNIIVDNCLMVGVAQNTTGIFFNTTTSTDSTVKNCTIKNCDSAILLFANNNAFISNTITNNFFGIILSVEARNNLVKDNNFFGNGFGIVQSIIGTNQFYFNNSCNNAVVNCQNVPVAGIPGQVPVTNGMNICCTNPLLSEEVDKARQDKIEGLFERINNSRGKKNKVSQ